ncbi:MAG: ferredoxin--NADP reductase [Bdellovibrionota bacterium]
MLASQCQCTVIDSVWLTPTVIRIRFSAKKKIPFLGGQFLSLYIPNIVTGKMIRRAYSFANGPGTDVYELCVKYLPGGAGSEFIASLRAGSTFSATAPYGHFVYSPKHAATNVCFINTATGVAPNRSIVQSGEFREHPPEKTFFFYGARTEDEIIYPGEFEKLGFETVNAISRPGENFKGFRGRVTDYLRSLPNSWYWHNTDFYICGNPDMIDEARDILKGGHGVDAKRIHAESFAPKKKKAA